MVQRYCKSGCGKKKGVVVEEKQVAYNIKYEADAEVECFKCKSSTTPAIKEVNIQTKSGSLMIYYKCHMCAYEGFVRLHLKKIPEGNLK